MSLSNNLQHQLKQGNAQHNHHHHDLKRNRILVLGRRGVGKLSLIKDIIAKSTTTSAITSQEETPASSTSTVESRNITEHDDPIHSGLTLPWRISTKYYTADVQFWIDETVNEESVDPKVLETYESEESGVGGVVDAVPSTFNDIRAFLPFIARYEPAITLAVERIGIDRVLEALQSHVWDGMTRISKVASGSRSKLYFNVDGDSGIKDNDDEYTNIHSSYSTVKLGNPELQYNQELLEAISKLKIGTDDNKKSKCSGPQIQQYEDNSDTELFQDIPNQKEIETMHQQLFGDIDRDDDDHDDINFALNGNGEASDGLERVLFRLTSLREKTKSLPDNERRKLAASVAFSFGMQLGND
ncbi:8323_t:CDS:2 [Ambispora gerdemannii]|uniref:8323_t:CDS:1 n=1 Tax=Ambispora gerdemannii TaxID=144530 RepID=A0A9N8VAQ3_9GLOM|nr:8323_t:CDS:2 [Ambispora gerdemannii]